ncbi:MAG: hypothetical protein ACI9VR_003521, partial [Cognaticolwellia sp.]
MKLKTETRFQQAHTALANLGPSDTILTDRGPANTPPENTDPRNKKSHPREQ